MNLKKLLCLNIFLLSFWFCATSQTIFINEISHLDGDKGVEIAGPAISNLAGWKLVIYDESGNIVNTIQLSAVIPDLQNNFGFVWIEVIAGFQGPSGGAALVDDADQLVQFLSYGNQIKGQEGIAFDIKSESAGVQTEGENALQLTGAGNTYTSFAWNLPGGFTPGAVNNGQVVTNTGPGPTILPVTWSYFTGATQQNDVQLKWATAAEQNNEYFRVEHSEDGKNFQEIGEVASKGNSQEEQKYDFNHRNKNNGTAKNYYRLMQVDFDGKSNVSQIIQVLNTNERSDIKLFPNPIQEHLWIQVPDIPENTLTIEIFNTVGKRVFVESVSTNDTSRLSLDALPKGNYILMIQGGTTPFIQKIIKE